MTTDTRDSFTYLSLFCFSMLGLVIGGTLLHLFIFWELVGFCSYLLIGFWYERRAPQHAAMKAFIVNRIGDFGFLIGSGAAVLSPRQCDVYRRCGSRSGHAGTGLAGDAAGRGDDQHNGADGDRHRLVFWRGG